MKITILGCGAYGTALANMFLENNCEIRMWNKFGDVFDKLRQEYQNVYFTTNLEESLKECELLVIAIPVAFIESVAKELANYYNNEDILIASKGISIDDGLLATEILKKELNTDNLGAISGGTFAVDMKAKKVMGLTLGTNSSAIKDKVRKSLENKFLKLQYTNDYLGVEICGAIKNVMAIGFGILDGGGFPESTKFLYLTEAIYEIKYLIEKLGGDSDTIMSYAGIDDIMMTCTSTKSRNYTLGNLIGSKKSLEEINNYKNTTTIEGLGTALAIHNICKNNNLELNICKIIYNILYDNQNSNALVEYLENK